MKRNFGLDLIRALAILLVLVDHAWYFNPNINPSLPNPLGATGFLGVELFFVLSGFLIGKIALKTFAHGGTIKKLFSFYIRRWFRTLPLYYFLLTGFIIVSNKFYGTNDWHPLHFVFLQNFIPYESDFFSIAWSLSIEEWFYLLLPLFLLSLSLVTRGKNMLKAILVTIAILSVVRFVVVAFDPLGFSEIRKTIPLRFDSLLVGVALAGLKLYYEAAYEKLKNVKIFFTSAAFLVAFCTYFTFIYIDRTVNTNLFYRSYGILLASLAIAGLIPFAESSSFLNAKIASKKFILTSVTAISLFSYSMYLTHLEVNTFIIKYFLGKAPVFVLFTASTAIAFFVSGLLYKFFELPFMNIREKIAHRN